MENVRLEYSPEKGKFKQVNATQLCEKEQGFYVLCCIVSTRRAQKFEREMLYKYPSLKIEKPGAYPSLLLMQEEFSAFTHELGLQQVHMAGINQRRLDVFQRR